MIRCNLFGCRPTDGGPFCRRCGASPYDQEEFVFRGRMAWLLDAWDALRTRVRRFLHPPRCEVCKRLLRKQDWNIGVCDRPKCRDSWLPFVFAFILISVCGLASASEQPTREQLVQAHRSAVFAKMRDKARHAKSSTEIAQRNMAILQGYAMRRAIATFNHSAGRQFYGAGRVSRRAWPHDNAWRAVPRMPRLRGWAITCSVAVRPDARRVPSGLCRDGQCVR